MRVKRGNVLRKRHKKTLARAKGFRGSLSKLFRPAKQAVTKALAHSYRGRKQKKRNVRSLWIIRLNAAAREHGISYSQLIRGLKKSDISINRKSLSELAVENPTEFASLIEEVKGALT